VSMAMATRWTGGAVSTKGQHHLELEGASLKHRRSEEKSPALLLLFK
jgi:hypothetical protein